MRSSRALRVHLQTAGGDRELAHAELADTALRRMKGLLGRDGLAEGAGLVLTPCNSVHTWFMRFAIDVVFLDGAGTVLRAVRSMRPFQLAWGGFRARTTIELPAGTLETIDVRPGAQIRIEPA
jgi:uncharacterized membrane protein (UPF0127 family)